MAGCRSIDENDARAFVRELCASVDVDLAGLGADLMLTWNQIRELGADARVTIGSHTRRHYALAKLTLGRGARRDRGGRAAASSARPVLPAGISPTPTETRPAPGAANTSWRANSGSRRV